MWNGGRKLWKPSHRVPNDRSRFLGRAASRIQVVKFPTRCAASIPLRSDNGTVRRLAMMPDNY